MQLFQKCPTKQERIQPLYPKLIVQIDFYRLRICSGGFFVLKVIDLIV
jgi:hypothetical protein